MDVVLYRHLQIFGTVMKSRPPEVKQAWCNGLPSSACKPWPLA